MRRKYTSLLPCRESTTETDAIINYAGKRPLFSQGDGRPSATCSSCLWSSLASCRETFMPIWLPDGERHSTKNEYKSCHTDEWFASTVKQLTDTLSCRSRGSCLFIATLVPFIKLNKTNGFISSITGPSKANRESTIPEPPPEETSNYPSHGCGIMAAHFFFLMTFIKRSPTIKALIHWNRQVCFLFSPDRPDINNGFIVAMRENEAKGNRTFRQWWTTQTDVENLDAHSLLMCWWAAESDFQS